MEERRQQKTEELLVVPRDRRKETWACKTARLSLSNMKNPSVFFELVRETKYVQKVEERKNIVDFWNLNLVSNGEGLDFSIGSKQHRPASLVFMQQTRVLEMLN